MNELTKKQEPEPEPKKEQSVPPVRPGRYDNLREMETGQMDTYCPMCGAAPIVLVKNNTIGVCPQCKFDLPACLWEQRRKDLGNYSEEGFKFGW